MTRSADRDIRTDCLTGAQAGAVPESGLPLGMKGNRAAWHSTIGIGQAVLRHQVLAIELSWGTDQSAKFGWSVYAESLA
jgi:hypothetical protein